MKNKYFFAFAITILYFSILGIHAQNEIETELDEPSLENIPETGIGETFTNAVTNPQTELNEETSQTESGETVIQSEGGEFNTEGQNESESFSPTEEDNGIEPEVTPPDKVEEKVPEKENKNEVPVVPPPTVRQPEVVLAPTEQPTDGVIVIGEDTLNGNILVDSALGALIVLLFI